MSTLWGTDQMRRWGELNPRLEIGMATTYYGRTPYQTRFIAYDVTRVCLLCVALLSKHQESQARKYNTGDLPYERTEADALTPKFLC